MLLNSRLPLFPITTTATQHGGSTHLTVGGHSLAELAEAYDTPLYVYDQATMDDAVAQYRSALSRHYPGKAEITFAGKSFLCLALAQWADRSGLWLDCTGRTELHIAAAAGMPRERILVHGVNKSVEDLRAANRQAAVLVIDNLHELDRTIELLRERPTDRHPDLWLRIRPGHAVDTHAYNQTGQEDSKFGMSATEAQEAVYRCRQSELPLTGIHFHQGSHFHDPAPVAPALDNALDLIAALRAEFDWMPRILSPGGGWGVPYHEDDLPHPSIDAYVRFLTERLVEGCRRRNLPLPALHMEPGRSIIARAGVALYRVGTVKETAGRRWLLIDGGLADNPRPALYNARYSALPVENPERISAGSAWIAGPYCESGDVLIENLPLPAIEVGELLAIPVSGAYQLALGSNYNGACKPAIVWLSNGAAHLVQRRQQPEDLLTRDAPLP